MANEMLGFARQLQCTRWLLPILLLASGVADAAIPDSERNVLIALYKSMNGDQWFYNDNWCAGACPSSGVPEFNASGTECSWKGVTCNDSGTHVVSLYLPGGTGSLSDLSGLTELVNFQAPAEFGDRIYQLTGPIPDLAGLKALQMFFVPDNQLTGSIPSLAGLTSLQVFNVSYNDLSGSLPDLSGLDSLQSFDANHNQLTGELPALSGFNGPLYLDVSYNRLIGSIPTLQANALSALIVSHNNLAGPLPSLDGLSNLSRLSLDNNQFSGSIASLNGLNLITFDVSHNKLSGQLPSLAAMSTWTFYVQDNYFSGSLPAPPNGLRLCELIPNVHCEAAICPNSFDLVDSPAWDSWLGTTPWWEAPFANNRCDDVFSGVFE